MLTYIKQANTWNRVMYTISEQQSRAEATHKPVHSKCEPERNDRRPGLKKFVVDLYATRVRNRGTHSSCFFCLFAKHILGHSQRTYFPGEEDSKANEEDTQEDDVPSSAGDACG